ncbi:MAG: helicase-related protein [Alkalispirochaeta sp.]
MQICSTSKRRDYRRGCEDDATQLLRDVGADVAPEDCRNPGNEISASFVGELSHEQSKAVASLLVYECGVLPFTHRIRNKCRRRGHHRRPEAEHPDSCASESSLVIENAQNKAIYEVYAVLVDDDERNDLIARDVLEAVQEGRVPLVLSERKRHLELLKDRLEPHVDNCALLVGGMGKKRTIRALESFDGSRRSVLLATGKLIGEGFDHPRLDTLFLTFPVSWKGIVQQYVGRLHRRHSGKEEVRVYDYADVQVPMLAASFRRRRKSYKRMGYTVADPSIH